MQRLKFPTSLMRSHLLKTYLWPTLCIALLSVSSLSACSDEADNSADKDVSSDVDPEGDAGDIGEDADTGPAACALQRDCGPAEICVDAVCVEAPACEGVDKWKSCLEAFTEISPDLARRASCDPDTLHCRAVCLLDDDCADDELCTDNGRCVAYDGDITGEHPGGDARAPLKAGVSNTLMNFPIGLSQGGYGSRMATNHGRYVESLSATDGIMEGMFARTFVLDNGERQLMFIRLPVVFPTMALHEAVSRKLQELTGKDWRESLVLTGTHTHSGPTRFWHLPGDAAVSLGSFGTDEFSQEVFGWMVETTVESAQAALDDLSPAKFGWEIVESFDNDDRIASDRWGGTPPFDDNRMLLFRIDDAQGTPRAVMVSFGSHGTVHSKNYFTNDVPGGIELGVERALAQEYGQFVPVFYLNENGGSMSPRGDHWGHESAERFEAVGHELAIRALPAIRDMDMKDDIALKGVTHRFPITYETIGYGPEEWKIGAIGKGSHNNVYNYGALNCLGSSEDDDPATYFTPPITEGCLPVHLLNHHRPASLFARSQISVLQLDELTMITLPGESTMELGWQVAREARDRYGVDPLKGWVMGYAQDHQFYLSPTNLRGELPVYPGISTPKAPDEYPDFAFSWLQGGYEAGLSVWGWKFGDFMVERAMEAVGTFAGADVEYAFNPIFPSQFSPVEQPKFPVDTSNAAQVGTVVTQPPATVARMTPIEFAWVGGDPGAEMPQAPKVALKKKVGAEFEPITSLNLRPYTNRQATMLTRMRNNGDNWEWVVYWEEIQNFELGTYRFEVEGHYMNAAGERTPYQVQSEAFEVVAVDDIAVTVDAESPLPVVRGVLGYAPGTQLSFDSTSDDRGKVSGNYRMRHPLVPLGQSAPLLADEDIDPSGVSVTITDSGSGVISFDASDITVTTALEAVNGRADVPVTRFEAEAPGAVIVPGTYQVEVSVTDAWGNTGSSTIEVTVD
ncbi:neutral/alkaline non-lysosomal ceramidase N-terminal domain-containing protein [Bradymonas sediminis]|uniref:Uncharacterized protein n=1 Tax=Bradymonas sediminis TaxID=1548548 RepID=A0A2Z4FPW2_9DELT|nr:neutral/alkaline non-lysosomal ceramidase N-terminal domain-containing protein [Bradymonas sediminis]AWV90664.1 hypothetical protein DN745_15615 [Bradymonas sediminis]TDP62698.1 neutral/alkaline ceramidase-like enzyme [Bradymonas sediminis]